MVASYRLIGYENRSLDNEYFENDSTDAGEIGSTQTITALYEIVLRSEDAKSNFAQFDFRYKKPGESVSRLISLNISNSPVNMNVASENMKFAASITGFGLLMKQSEYKGTVSKQMVLDLGRSALGFDPFGYREEFINLVEDWNQ